MRKSPLSAPGGSGGRKSYDWNSRDRRHGYNGSGYGGQIQRENYECFSPGSNQNSPQKGGDDFIPLGCSSPADYHPRNSGNWRGSGNGFRRRGTPGNGGYNSYRNNSYHDSPKSSFNNSHSANYFQKHSAHQRPRHKNAHRNVDISNYLDVKSILEDPWANLMKKLNSSRSLNESKSETVDCNASGSSGGSFLIGETRSKNLETESQESRVANEDKSELGMTTMTS